MIHRLKSYNFYVLLVLDAALVLAAHGLSYLIRFEGALPAAHVQRMIDTLGPLLLVKLLCFLVFGLYRGMWRYTSLSDMANIAKAASAATLFIVGYLVLSRNFAGYSRSVFVLDWFFTMAFVAGLRVGIRLFYGMGFVDLPSVFRRHCPASTATRCVIIGAGNSAERLLRDMSGNPRAGILVAALFDDDPAKQGRELHGVPVVGPVRALGRWMESDQFRAREALIAISNISGPAMREVIGHCEASGLAYRRIPSLAELAQGKVTVKNLRDVDYKDLLGREPVHLDMEGIAGCLRGRTVLVTGAGGSIGSELCRQIVAFEPGRLLLLDACESNLYAIQMEMEHEYGFKRYETLLGTLQDTDWTAHVLDTYRPEVVFHAAAYKHVPMLEENPWQAVLNNVLATRNLVEAAVSRGVERLLVVSTDKAVRPTNVMGASKRITEKIMQAHCGRGTRLMAVRFGNVIGSAGSVIPLFRRQIERGGPVTITHPEVTRFFMTTEEACQLILQAGSMGEGGEIFVLKMGKPVRIADMAADLIRLSGKEPGRDIEIKFIGLRPGEKLFEELITADEGVVPTGHDQIMVLRSDTCAHAGLDEALEHLRQAAEARDHARIRQQLVEVVPEYVPDHSYDSK